MSDPTLTFTRLDEKDRAAAARLAQMLRDDAPLVPPEMMSSGLAAALQHFLDLSSHSNELYIAKLAETLHRQVAFVSVPDAELSLEDAVLLFNLPRAVLENALHKGHIAFSIIDDHPHMRASDLQDFKDRLNALRPIMQEMYNMHSTFDERDDITSNL